MSTKRNVPFHSSDYRCLNCNRILTSDLKEVDNDAVSQDCWCGHRNYFDAIDGHWEQTTVKILPERQKTMDKGKDIKQEEPELFLKK